MNLFNKNRAQTCGFDNQCKKKENLSKSNKLQEQ